MKELMKLNHRGYINWQQWWFDDVFCAEICSFMVFFMILLHFCRFSLIFINMQIR